MGATSREAITAPIPAVVPRRSPVLPWAAGVIAALAVLIVWGSFAPLPVMHDEAAYWMQADQYAHFRWFEPSPRLPEFFEQLYVLVTPVYAAKYWPGHAMLVAPGFLMRLPALVPLLLTGVTGALVVVLARRLAGTRVAVVTFVLWLSTFGNLRFRAAYFSEVTTSCAWLIAWWALLEWRATRHRRWMSVMAVACGWGAITRPATMFVFFIPVAVVVLRDVLRYRLWPDLGRGTAIGLLILGILPAWNDAVTGSARTTPLALYTRQYLPFDVPGYAVRSAAPSQSLPPEMERVRGFLRDIKVEQATAPVWRTFAARAGLLLRDAFDGWRLPLAAAFVAGLFVAGAAGWFAIGTSALLIVGYLSQAHTADWTVYYLETFPAIAFITALGLEAIVARLARHPRGSRWPAPVLWTAGAAAALLVARDVVRARDVLARVAAPVHAFHRVLEALPDNQTIVFVRYAQGRNMHLSLVANGGILEGAPYWIVHDRGVDNVRLRALAPHRVPFLFDEASGVLAEIVP